jgi:hypothetical protein
MPAASRIGIDSLSLAVDGASVAGGASTAAVRTGAGRATVAPRVVAFDRAEPEVTSTVALAATGTVGA